MKKKILLFIFVPFLLTACNNQNTDIEKKSDTAENVSSDTAENVSVISCLIMKIVGIKLC